LQDFLFETDELLNDSVGRILDESKNYFELEPLETVKEQTPAKEQKPEETFEENATQVEVEDQIPAT
jgi:hypothetical protein